MQQGKTATDIAKTLNKDGGSVRKTVRRIRELSAKGMIPDYFAMPAAPGFEVTGTSTYIDNQWVKTSRAQHQKIELIKQFCESVASDKAPPKVKLPKTLSKEWLNVIVIADLHLGLECYPEAGRNKWNIEIAEKTIIAGIREILNNFDPAETCWIVNGGDLTHANDYKKATPYSGHSLDQDGPFRRTQLAAGRLMKWLVTEALKTHKHVKIVNVPGNHDPDVSGWMDVLVNAVFEENKRVQLSEPDGAFHHLKFGKNYILAAHGDLPRGAKTKYRDLGDLMVNHEHWHGSVRREVWTGHVHNDSVQTLRNGIIGKSFTTMIPVDQYAHSQGYRTNQTLHSISLHKSGLREKTDSIAIDLLDLK